jgi:predicted phage terminase large subunit-like protein
LSVADYVAGLPEHERTAVLRKLAVKWRPPRLRYLPTGMTLSAKQELFLSLAQLEAFFGGAAGPGKSTALLAGALQYADVPGYSALLLRRSYADLMLPGALMDMAQEWLGPTDAKWRSPTMSWKFPSGATLTFGYLEHEEQKRRYASARFHYIAFDELSQFTETQYEFLFSRLRRPAASPHGRAPDGMGAHQIPLRMRAASNPGGAGHNWVKRRLVDVKTRRSGAAFIPSRLIENPHLDVASYEQSLSHVGPVERERLLRGDWDVTEEGTLFRATLWCAERYLDAAPSDLVRCVRHWDLAASEPSPSYPDPDWTVGTLLGLRESGRVAVLDVKRFRSNPGDVEQMIRATAEADSRDVRIGIEQEPGSAGKGQADHYRLKVLRGFIVEADKVTGDKATRAVAVASAMSKGDVDVVRAAWVPEWLAELDGFPKGHDDQVDSLSGAHTLLVKGGPLSSAVPRGDVVPQRVVREDSTARDVPELPEPNGKPLAAGATQGIPKRLNRRGASRVDVTPFGPNRGGL